MKIITNFAILFVLIVIPFYLVMDLRTADQKEVNQLEKRYSASLRTATQDAAFALNQNENQEKEAGYQSDKYSNANKEEAIRTFFKTMHLNFNVENDPIAQGALAGYIPVVAITDYKGFHIYALTEYKDGTGQTIFKHMWMPEKPYAYSDERGNSINFSLDSFVTAYDASAGTWISGYREELEGLTNIPLLNDPATFEAIRRSTIVNLVQEDVAHYINKHNTYATRYGLHYEFKLPLISQEDWANSINDIGIMAFVQGIPIGDQFYNNYAFGSGRLVKKDVVYGTIDDSTGLKYYYPSSYPLNYRVIETFDSEKDAAAAGYMPTMALNKK